MYVYLCTYIYIYDRACVYRKSVLVCEKSLRLVMSPPYFFWSRSFKHSFNCSSLKLESSAAAAMEAASIESEEKLATRVGWFTRYIDFIDTSRWNFYVPIPPPAHGSSLPQKYVFLSQHGSELARCRFKQARTS